LAGGRICRRLRSRHASLDLRDQHAVEGIAVMGGQAERCRRVLEGDRERFEAALGHPGGEIGMQLQFAEPDLDRARPSQPPGRRGGRPRRAPA
jgi:hypothetical protein